MNDKNVPFTYFLARISYQAERALKFRNFMLTIFGVGYTCLLYKLKKSTFK